MTKLQIETLIKYKDICGEIRDTMSHMINNIPLSYDLIKDLYVAKSEILVPSWLFKPNTLQHLFELGYITKKNRRYGLTEKGFRLAFAFTFYWDKEYVIEHINYQDAIDLLMKELNLI